MRKPITPHQMNLHTSQIVEVYESLESEILVQVAKRIKSHGVEDLTEWHVDKLKQLNLLNRDIEHYLSKATGVARHEIRGAIEANGYRVVKDTDEYMKEAGRTPLVAESIDPVMESYINQTFLEIDNYVNQTLITTNFGTGTVTKMYQDIINKTVAKQSAGLMTLDEAIEDTIMQWVDKGVPSSFIDRGGHTWNIDRYVETVLKSTNARIYNDLRTSRMDEYGVYTVLVSSKPNSRESCSHIQGQVVDVREPHLSDGKYPNIYDYGYGTPAGHRGINCGHQWFPFIPGVNTNNQPQYDAREAQEAEAVEQKRKSIARRIKNTKRKIMVAEALESDSVGRYKKLLRRQQAEMRDYISETGLRRNYRLEKVYTPVETLLNE